MATHLPPKGTTPSLSYTHKAGNKAQTASFLKFPNNLRPNLWPDYLQEKAAR